LEGLRPDEARDLIIEIANRVNPDQATRISELCGYLPLALRAAGNLLLVTKDMDVDEYIERLADERTRIEQIGATDIPEGVEASFNLSYRWLDAETARVFRYLSVFPSSFDRRAEESICEDLDHKRLSELARLSMVQYNEAEGE